METVCPVVGVWAWLNVREERAGMCSDCVCVWGGTCCVQIRTSGEGLSWLPPWKQPDPSLSCSESPLSEGLCLHAARPSDFLHQTWRFLSPVVKPKELEGLKW